MDLSEVRVHYNSSKPAQVGALAYTQGTDIHVAPGQEEHLPHEAWHVVQQAQGRVRPTMQFKGVAVNDDAGLEQEASEMGDKIQKANDTGRMQLQRTPGIAAVAPVQRRESYSGMTDSLRSGLEGWAGLDIQKVRALYNSGKAGEIGAVGSGQGMDIPVALGQEKDQHHGAESMDAKAIGLTDNSSKKRQVTQIIQSKRVIQFYPPERGIDGKWTDSELGDTKFATEEEAKEAYKHYVNVKNNLFSTNYLKMRKNAKDPDEEKISQALQEGSKEYYPVGQMLEEVKGNKVFASMLEEFMRLYGKDFKIGTMGERTFSNPFSGFINISGQIPSLEEVHMAAMQEVHNVLAREHIKALELNALGAVTKERHISREEYIFAAEAIEYSGVLKQIQTFKNPFNYDRFKCLAPIGEILLKENPEIKASLVNSKGFLEYMKIMKPYLAEHMAKIGKRYDGLQEWGKAIRTKALSLFNLMRKANTGTQAQANSQAQTQANQSSSYSASCSSSPGSIQSGGTDQKRKQ
ncbi:MAG TPA: DUF4157 domain-containing protein [Bacillota bacterium]|nr:DUF4157 domain-containing protein [Bacillota bacterium]